MRKQVNNFLLKTLIFLSTIGIIYFIRRAFFLDKERIIFFGTCLILLVLFLTLLIFVKFKNQKIQSNFLIFFFSSLISLYVLELTMFKLKYNKENFQFLENVRAAKIEKVDFDDRNIFKFYKDYNKNKNENSVISMSRVQVSIDNKIVQTLGGIGNRETILCNESGYWTTFKSDRYGFNNPDELWDKKLDVVIVGDSFGLGLCVNQDQNFAGVLRKNGKKSITLGGTGMGTLFEYAILREYTKNIETDNLIFMFYLNDLHNLNSELSNPILLNYLNDNNFSQNLALNQNNINIKLEEKLINYINKKKFLTLERIAKFYYIREAVRDIIYKKDKNVIFSRFEIDEQKLNKVIEILKKVEDDFKGNLYIGYLPSAAEYMFKENEKKLLKEISDRIVNKLKANSFDVIDFRLSLDSKELDEILPFGSIVKTQNHYNAKGYKLISNQMLEHLYK